MTENSVNSADLNGTVQWFNSEKGYGFLKPSTGGEDVFVHYSNIEVQGFAALTEGQQVTYQLGEGPRGLTATHVRPA